MAEPNPSEPQKPPEAPPPAPRQPLSKEAWVGISAITAAAITGIVSLITHFTPAPSAAPAVPTSPPTQTAQPAPLTPADGIARLVGKWSGPAENDQGKYQIDLEISPNCALGQPCGIIRVSNVPCYGNVSLFQVKEGEYDFSVDSFRSGSAKSCTAGAGELFVLTAEGKLIYRTDYDASVRGVLSRLP